MATAKGRILVADDDPALRRLMVMRLAAAGYEVETADSGDTALARLALFRPNLVITDLLMPDLDGLALFAAIHRRDPALPVIILTAHGTIPDAVEATRNGVFGYLTKPFESQVLLEWVDHALRVGAGPAAERSVPGDHGWRDGLIARSAGMENLLRQALLVAAGDAAVLIQGDSGTGKELLARAIHRASARRDAPFIAVNATAIPDTLLESELFGHGRGAFTGAHQAREGLFKAAEGGTLFLDEIGDMPLAFQAKLLRALQEREIRPLGADRTVRIDVRVISATHRNLEQAVAQRTFREDLYYRLNVVPLEIPPLAARRDDIPLLVAHFFAAAGARAGKTVKGFSPQALELLVSAPWPGNVRQLQNVVEQTVALATAPLIPESLVRRALRDKSGDFAPLSAARDDFERDYLVQLLQITGGNVSRAARLAQRNRTEFYKLLHRHHLDPEQFRGAV